MAAGEGPDTCPPRPLRAELPRGRVTSRWAAAYKWLLTPFSAVLALPVCIAALQLSGQVDRWAEYNRQASWRRLFSDGEGYQGRFATPQAEYLYGQRKGQFLVTSFGGVTESLPETEHASEVVALSLAQHPSARNALVIGPGSLAICTRLSQLPKIRRVVWLHPDAHYPDQLLSALSRELAIGAADIELPGREVRAYLSEHPAEFDLVLLNLPDATSLVLNRYWTRDFYALAKEALTEDGVLCSRLSGAANYLGGELAHLGASAVETLESEFRHLVLKPGDDSWLIASDGGQLSDVSSKPLVVA